MLTILLGSGLAIDPNQLPSFVNYCNSGHFHQAILQSAPMLTWPNPYYYTTLTEKYSCKFHRNAS